MAGDEHRAPPWHDPMLPPPSAPTGTGSGAYVEQPEPRQCPIDEGREQEWKLVVGGGFKANQDEIGYAYFFGSAGALGADGQVTLGTADGDAVSANDVLGSGQWTW